MLLFYKNTAAMSIGTVNKGTFNAKLSKKERVQREKFSFRGT